eukprot:4366394-Alexandrium_andersonii.AAC.1
MVEEELRCLEAAHPSEALSRPKPRAQGSKEGAAESGHKVRREVRRALVANEPHRLLVLLREVVAALREKLS